MYDKKQQILLSTLSFSWYSDIYALISCCHSLTPNCRFMLQAFKLQSECSSFPSCERGHPIFHDRWTGGWCFTTTAKHWIFGFTSLRAEAKGTSLREAFWCLRGEERLDRGVPCRQTSICRRGIMWGELCAIILTDSGS